MKALGVILIGMGLALLFFTVLNFFLNTSEVVSPVPNTKGVQIIMVSPTK